MDGEGALHQIGQIKIGFVGQKELVPTMTQIQSPTFILDDTFFSLAESPEFYSNLYKVGKDFATEVLQRLNCVLIDDKAMAIALTQNVYNTSLIRNVNIITLRDQFKRVMSGYSLLTDYNFRFVRNGKGYSDLYLDFSVEPESFPPTNIHTIIGRNGLGKTTLLNEMIASIFSGTLSKGGYFEDVFAGRINKDYFSTVISIAFSAFDPFHPMNEQRNPNHGTCFYYIGLKTTIEERINRSHVLNMETLHEKCADALYECFSDTVKREMWFDAMLDLESDENFKELNILGLSDYTSDHVKHECASILGKMSSGHAIVFITITMLIEKLQEKTLVLFDEPESHLHPPLLSALVRIMSNVLLRRNGVAIIATHSPVVVQEVPKSCCWLLTRYGDVTDYSRPEIETFAENVGTITKEVFKLEMEKSGYHKILKSLVEKGFSFEQIVGKFQGQIGFEGKAILMSLIALRDSMSKDLFNGKEND